MDVQMKESGLRIRVDSQLREDFLRVCKQDDLTAAQVLRAFMRSYVDRKLNGKRTALFQEVLGSKKNDVLEGLK